MAVSQAEILKQKAKEAIDLRSSELKDLGKRIWKKPELKFEESYAHDELTSFLAECGFDVTPHYTLDTAFRAETGEDGGLTVGLICEYDALPELGHACGHNLIAESGVAAALGLKMALMEVNQKPKFKIVVLGTPGEEERGGKILMINNGCFKDIDFCIMVHPGREDVLKPTLVALDGVTVTYKGVASHAALAPWHGINALDAAVMAYNNISVLRQQMKPAWRVNGIITEGGVKPNITPDCAQLKYSFRAPTDEELKVLKQKITKCFEAAGTATGCEASFEWRTNSYSHLDTNNTLAELYQANAESLGVTFPETAESAASSDIGNVSHVTPTIEPGYAIGTTAANHSRAFNTAAGTEVAHEKTLIASKALAMTAIDVLCNPDLIDKVRNDFEKSHPTYSE